MNRGGGSTGSGCLILIITGLLCLMFLGTALKHAHGHDAMHPDEDAWYSSLKQPDNPTQSCCGKADAYWCDIIHVKSGHTTCTITDDRDDVPLLRPHVDIGTEIPIPDHKLTWKDGNPTGHAIVFLSREKFVYCFVQNGGV